MSAAILFLTIAAIAFLFWMALGSRWLIWAFVFLTLVIAIDATHTGIANQPLLPLTALNDGG